LIVGPGDESDRFTYWAVRVARAAKSWLLANLRKTQCNSIDARDLAEWTIRMAEQGTTGILTRPAPIMY